jgi:Fe-S-cluster containining protein
MMERRAEISGSKASDSLDFEVPEGHQCDEYGEHDPDECYACLLARDPVAPSCQCGQCCRLIIEVSLEDAEREPRIKELGSPIYQDARLTESGEPELIGYLLNRPPSYACAFLDEHNLCSIYPTRPILCRLFNCEEAKHEGLIDLGIKERSARATT